MMKKLLLAGALLVGVPLLVGFVARSPLMVELVMFVQTNFILFLFALLIAKTVSIIYPPLPGAILTLGSIPLVGWQSAYFIDILGSTLGASAAYFLGSKYGVSILHWAIGKRLTTKITSLKIKRSNQIEAAFMLRLASGGMLSDGLSWGASLIGLKYIPFMIGYLTSHLVTTLPVFFLVSISISLKSWIIAVPFALLAVFLIYRLKGRYFE